MPKPEFTILNQPTSGLPPCMSSNSHNNGQTKPTIRMPSDWSKTQQSMLSKLTDANLNTICAQGACPNIAECWSKKHAAFMILGDVCTRRCTFCYVKKGRPITVDINEPDNLARTCFDMGLKHVVITSVTRDDLKYGGADHFVQCINAIRALYESHDQEVTIEVLTPDFKRKEGALELVVAVKPDVFNHNVETVQRLYPTVRIGSSYTYSMQFLKRIKELDPMLFTKSGFMLGLGETEQEVIETLQDLRQSNVDFVTIGQYLQPSSMHISIEQYITDETFARYKEIALSMGFLMVSSSRLTRSSYHAGEHFAELKAQRLQSRT